MQRGLWLLIGLAATAIFIWLWFWKAKVRIHSETSYPIPAESAVGVAKPKTLPMLREPSLGQSQTR